MNSNAQKWLAALRSDEFQQSTRVLKTLDGTYCCLGVACELYRRATGDGEWYRTDPDFTVTSRLGYEFRTASGDHSLVGLTDDVRHWLGFTADVSGEGAIYDKVEPLSNANDNLGYSFAQIADLVEEHADVYFSEDPA